MSESQSSGIHLIHNDSTRNTQCVTTPKKAVQIGGTSFSTDGSDIFGSYVHVLEREGMTKKLENAEEATLQINAESAREVTLMTGKNSLHIKNLLDISPNGFINIVKTALNLKQITLPPEIAQWVKPERMTGADLLVTIRGNPYRVTPSGEIWTAKELAAEGHGRNAEKLKTPLHALLPKFLKDNLQIGTNSDIESMKTIEMNGQSVLECVTWKGQTVRITQEGKLYIVEGDNIQEVKGTTKYEQHLAELSLVMPDSLKGRIKFVSDVTTFGTVGRTIGRRTGEEGVDLWVYPRGRVEIERLRISHTGRMTCSPEQIEFFRKFPTLKQLETTSDVTLKKLVTDFLAIPPKK